MNTAEHDLLNRYEENLRKTLIDFLTKENMMEGRILEVEELNEKWKSSAPSYMKPLIHILFQLILFYYNLFYFLYISYSYL